MDWKEISKQSLTASFIEENHEELDWTILSLHQKFNISEELIRAHFKACDLQAMFTNQYISQEFAQDFHKDINWDILSKYPLQPEQITAYEPFLNWKIVSKFSPLTLELIEKYQDKIDWIGISSRSSLPKEFMDTFDSKVDWMQICSTQNLSFDFILKHIEKGNISDMHLMLLHTMNPHASFSKEEKDTFTQTVKKRITL